LWVVFSITLLMLWDNWNRHQGHATLFGMPVQTPPATRINTSTTVPTMPPATTAAVPNVPNASNVVLPSASTALPVATPATGELITLQNNLLKLTINTLGGDIQKVELLQHRDSLHEGQHVTILDTSNQRVYQAQSGLVSVTPVPNHKSLFVVDKAKSSSSQWVLRSETNGVVLEKIIALKPDAYLVQMTHHIVNQTTQAIQPTVYLQMIRDGNKPEGESKFYSTFTGPAYFTQSDKFNKIEFKDIEKGKSIQQHGANNGWIAMVQHYFVTAWLLPDQTPRTYYTRKVTDNLYSIGMTQVLPVIQTQQAVTHQSQLFVGPQDQHVLSKLADGLDLVVDYGILTVVAKPLFWLLEQLHQLLGNWGWSIIAITVLIKLALFPLSAASYRSMAKMKTITPKMLAIKERYADDRMKQSQEMMALYKTEGVNPMGGCLPIVMQVPVFISLYWVLLASVEMRMAPWLGWIQDLSAPDPWFILPAVMAITMIIQTRLNPTPPDPLQAKVMMIMPLVFSVMFIFFPSGLVLYWIVNNILSIAQQWQINRMIETSGAQDKKRLSASANTKH
jgi:YidC/Oxa1 family membrane protein insertase